MRFNVCPRCNADLVSGQCPRGCPQPKRDTTSHVAAHPVAQHPDGKPGTEAALDKCLACGMPYVDGA
ncbi:MAG TPA: hypothetical protein PLP17_15715, partial [Oligoflexia bacterium]|nr:hypothetical protein [Oligoflexia bacterium]